MIQGHFRNGKITAWLLPVALVISLFTFSGTNSPASAKQSSITTEQIDALRVSNKKCTAFKIIGTKFSSQLDNSALRFHQIAFSHTLAVRTQVRQCAQNCLEFIGFSPTIPQ